MDGSIMRRASQAMVDIQSNAINRVVYGVADSLTRDVANAMRGFSTEVAMRMREGVMHQKMLGRGQMMGLGIAPTKAPKTPVLDALHALFKTTKV